MGVESLIRLSITQFVHPNSIVKYLFFLMWQLLVQLNSPARITQAPKLMLGFLGFNGFITHATKRSQNMWGCSIAA